MAARLLVGWQLHHMSPLSSLPCMRVHTERDSGSREETGPVRSSRESLRASAATHTQREREREENGSTPPRGPAAAPHVSSPPSAMRVHTERDSGSREETGPVRSSRESLRASAATHTQREREREVNGSTPPRGMAAASHVSSLLSAMRVHTERDSGSRAETGPVGSSRESAWASGPTHAQRERERERGEWQHASSWDGSRITCLLSPLCHARAH